MNESGAEAEYEMSKLLKQTYSSFMTNGISLQRSKIHIQQ